MRDCHLKNTSDRVAATCGHMPRYILPDSLKVILKIILYALTNHNLRFYEDQMGNLLRGLIANIPNMTHHYIKKKIIKK